MAEGPRRTRRSLWARLRRLPETAVPAAGMPDDVLQRQADLQYYLGRRAIETSIDDPVVARRFMDRVIGQWQALGEAEPYWSNDTQDQFRRENLTDDKIRDFYADGLMAKRAVEAFESRSGVAIPGGVCVELGCGVGKHTHVLAERFERVVAIDVSAGGLDVCAARMKAMGIANVETKLLTSPDDLADCGPTDFFFSLSVLQHNPPPVQKLLLDRGLAALRPGGFCLFQTPDWIENYSFSSAEFLGAGEAMFDLHCLPKTDVLETLDANAMRLLDFAPDFTIALFGSYTYFARKMPAQDAGR